MSPDFTFLGIYLLSFQMIDFGKQIFAPYTIKMEDWRNLGEKQVRFALSVQDSDSSMRNGSWSRGLVRAIAEGQSLALQISGFDKPQCDKSITEWTFMIRIG